MICATCGEEIEVKIIRYGMGYVGVCPICGGVAYNKAKESDEEPDEEEADDNRNEERVGA